MENQEPEYLIEEYPNADGTKRRIMKTQAGVVMNEATLDSSGRELESRSFDPAGNLTARAVYERDDQRKPLKTTSYDHKGNLVFIHERGKQPIFYGEHQAGAPPFMRADNQKKS